MLVMFLSSLVNTSVVSVLTHADNLSSPESVCLAYVLRQR